jgi:hypothetical protein
MLRSIRPKRAAPSLRGFASWRAEAMPGLDVRESHLVMKLVLSRPLQEFEVIEFRPRCRRAVDH